MVQTILRNATMILWSTVSKYWRKSYKG